MIQNKDKLKERAINALFLHSSFIDNIGLLNGKMGIAIAFFHLSRKTGNSLYENYAGELIDEIYNEISTSTPWNFADGLAGIGWGIEYLAQNNFIEANTDEILIEIDSKITDLEKKLPKEINISNGLLGIGAYMLFRIKGQQIDTQNLQRLKNRQLFDIILKEINKRTQNVLYLIEEPTKLIKQELNILNNKSEQKIFDITWDYPILLLFLYEVYRLNICKELVYPIFERLIIPLANMANYPRLKTNQLLLAVVLCKISKDEKKQLDFSDRVNKKEISIADLDITAKQLLNNIKQNELLDEVNAMQSFLVNGSLGVAFLYQQLWEVLHKKNYKEEAKFWCNYSLENLYLLDNRDSAMALLSGFCGYIVSSIAYN